MDINNLIRVSVFSFFVILILNWIYFFNWIGLIGKLVYLINPEYTGKEFEENRRITKHKEYRKHQRKWNLIFLCVPFTFSVLFLICAVLIKKAVLAYFLTFLVIIVCYFFLTKHENKARKKVLLSIADN